MQKKCRSNENNKGPNHDLFAIHNQRSSKLREKSLLVSVDLHTVRIIDWIHQRICHRTVICAASAMINSKRVTPFMWTCDVGQRVNKNN